DKKTAEKTSSDKQPLIIVDGEPYTNYKIDEQGELDLNIPSESIHSVNVFKDEKAIEKYGDAAKNGVVEIVSKKQAAKMKAPANQSEKKKTEQHLMNEKIASDKRPLLVVDGKILAKETTTTIKSVADIDPENIATINVVKGEAALKKYGDQGKDGVVEITTKNKTSSEKLAPKDIEKEFKKEGLVIINDTWNQVQEVTEKKEPLFVVDGKKLAIKKGADLPLDSKDILSIDVLKGQSALALYGDEGKNGVVVVTTKAGNSTKKLKKKKKQKATKQLSKAQKKQVQQKEPIKPNVKAEKVAATEKFGLSVFPNPTRQLTNIQLKLEQKGKVKVIILNVKGQVVFNLVNEVLDEGIHDFQWNSSDQLAGNYFVQLEVNGKIVSKQVIVKN
ncbi:MAG: T9SS type A sorting domain-containing protein, partial [Bacteroidota bacterium]